jgi:hypothetical protein
MTIILSPDGTWLETDQPVIEEPDGSLTIMGPGDNIRGISKPVRVLRDEGDGS